MRLHRFASSWRIQLLAALALVHDAGCGSPPRAEITCTSDPVLFAGKPTGLQSCSNNVVHRAAAATCVDPFPRPSPACTSDNPDRDECHDDAECPGVGDSSRPFCAPIQAGAFCTCKRGCVADADCGPDSVCICGEPAGSCPASACRTDADCPGSLCVAPVSAEGVVLTFACLSPADECVVDADCDTFCFFDRTIQARRCNDFSYDTGGGSGCFGSGRPFLVDGEARTADCEGRADWRTGGAPPSLAAISPADRAAAAAGWTRAGLLEHASIAAFARFTLQLLALGAPMDLVRDAQAAMADETEHTRLCFTLASAFGGSPVGPGPLDMTGAWGDGTPRGILITTIQEGCLGETIAALEAEELSRSATDPAVRRALATIAADEARHAELAWRFVQWALARDPALAPLARATFAAAAEAASASGPLAAEEGPTLAEHGIAGAGLRREIARTAIELVVTPCAQALLASASTRTRRGSVGSLEASPEPLS